MSVIVVTKPTSASLDDLVKEAVKEAESEPGLQVHKPITQQRVTLPAGEALEVGIRTTYLGIQLVDRDYFILKSGAGYIVTLTSALKDVTMLAPTFDQIINSFRLT
jgi:hypothetical protein